MLQATALLGRSHNKGSRDFARACKPLGAKAPSGERINQLVSFATISKNAGCRDKLSCDKGEKHCCGVGNNQGDGTGRRGWIARSSVSRRKHNPGEYWSLTPFRSHVMPHRIENPMLVATSQDGSVLTRLGPSVRAAVSYSPHGHAPVMPSLAAPAFTGQWHEPRPDCYLLGNGYRAYNPRLMRFNSPDSFSPFGEAGINSYAYCEGDPINDSDPNGNLSLKSFRKFARRMFGSKRASVADLTSNPNVALTHSITTPRDMKSIGTTPTISPSSPKARKAPKASKINRTKEIQEQWKRQMGDTISHKKANTLDDLTKRLREIPKEPGGGLPQTSANRVRRTVPPKMGRIDIYNCPIQNYSEITRQNRWTRGDSASLFLY